MRKPKRKKRQKPEEPKRIEFETFREFLLYDISNLKQDEPSCFNQIVRIRKFRVVIEPVEEPVEVLQERIQKLWDECDNHHHWDPLESVARELGYELQGRAGTKRRAGP